MKHIDDTQDGTHEGAESAGTVKEVRNPFQPMSFSPEGTGTIGAHGTVAHPVSHDKIGVSKGAHASYDVYAPIVRKIILTDEEKETLVRLRNAGNMSQPEAMEYHRLLNAEDGISGKVIVQERRLKELQAKDKLTTEEEAVKSSLLKLDEKAKAKQDADEALVKEIAENNLTSSPMAPIAKAEKAVVKAQEEVDMAEKAYDEAEVKAVVV